MPDYNTSRENLVKIQDSIRAFRKKIFTLNEKKKRLELRRIELMRVYSGKYKPDLEELRNKEVVIEKELAFVEDNLALHMRVEHLHLQGFDQFTDPIKNINQFDAAYPIFLFPLKMETRFKFYDQKHWLWVRLFPDTAAIDTFEDVPTNKEVADMQIYWSRMWASGSYNGGEPLWMEQEKRTAWSNLVRSYGSGRAMWLTEKYLPLPYTEGEIPELPERTNEKVLLLVIPTEEEQIPNEIDLIQEFWTKYWAANNDLSEKQKIYTKFELDIGSQIKAERYFEMYKPVNIDTEYNAEINVQSTFLIFPNSDKLDIKQNFWTQAPKVNIMPERFVIMGFDEDKNEILNCPPGNRIPSTLFVGPNPSAEKKAQMRQEDGDLKLNKDIKWLGDFGEAIEKGLGFKIEISEELANNGIKSLIALGVRMSADYNEGQKLLENLFSNHASSKKGFSIVPQGTPTNNTEKENSGYTVTDDPDMSFNYLKRAPLFEPLPNKPYMYEKKDGQWLSELLGVDYRTFQKVMHADGEEQREARAMNIALWPATLGYMMGSMMNPLFSEVNQLNTRDFFNTYVSGRGSLPAIRIGNQPYGLLPTTRFSKLSYSVGFYNSLHNIILSIENKWQESIFPLIKNIGNTEGEDAHKVLLNILGLNPNSVEYYHDLINSNALIDNTLAFNSIKFTDVWNNLKVKEGKDLIGEIYETYNNADLDLFKKNFSQAVIKLKNKLIDDNPLSETKRLKEIAKINEEACNYIGWLSKTAKSHSLLTQKNGFKDDIVPNYLLFRLLFHALDLSHVNLSLELYREENLISEEEYQKEKVTKPFLHIETGNAESESSWKFLYASQQTITGSSDKLLHQHITENLHQKLSYTYLNQQIDALELLQKLPTARLERLLTEHLDCCSYRIDAWKMGMIKHHLFKSRYALNSNDQYRKGIYLGAFGYLENVKSENKNLKAVPASETVSSHFLDKEGHLPRTDESNAGYIIAPSLNQAVSAAVTRGNNISGIYNFQESNVNLSSRRIKNANTIIEGIINGQALGALLGYEFERNIHNNTTTGLEYFIYEFRRAFPYIDDKMDDEHGEEENNFDAQETIKAYNVVDGLQLIEHMQKPETPREYPYGKDMDIENISPEQKNEIEKEVAYILALHDACSDLMLFENVHQLTQGNYTRANSVINALGKAKTPPVPESIITPRSGFTITHRTAIHLKNIDPKLDIHSPRAIAEPALNEWIERIIPDSENIFCTVSIKTDTTEHNHNISMNKLGLSGIDLIYMLNNILYKKEPDSSDHYDFSDKDQPELNRLITNYVMHDSEINTSNLSLVRINYDGKPNEEAYAFTDVIPMINSLKELVFKSRPLILSDVCLPSNGQTDQTTQQYLNFNRIELNYRILSKYYENILDYFYSYNITDVIEKWDEKEDSDKLDGIDKVINGYLSIINTGSSNKKNLQYLFQINELATERIYYWKRSITNLAVKLIEEQFERLKNNNNKDNYTELYGNQESHISSIPLQLKEMAIQEIFTDIIRYDFDPVDFSQIKKQVIACANEVIPLIKDFMAGLDKKVNLINHNINTAQSLPLSDTKRFELILKTIKMMFGENFMILPGFKASSKIKDEWNNALNAKERLLSHLTTTAELDFPIDEWLHGVSRVREKMHHWEKITLLAEVYQTEIPELTPLQFPYREKDYWMAMEFPEPDNDAETPLEDQFRLDIDRLLYTAYYPNDFNNENYISGLLLDEWTEAIPTKEETGGVSFHYDAPNTEAPQTLLLALHSNLNGKWDWQELVNIIHETMDMAKQRGVEPELIQKTKGFPWFLPALISASSSKPITSSLDYSIINSEKIQFKTEL